MIQIFIFKAPAAKDKISYDLIIIPKIVLVLPASTAEPVWHREIIHIEDNRLLVCCCNVVNAWQTVFVLLLDVTLHCNPFRLSWWWIWHLHSRETLVEDKILRFKGECSHFRFNKCSIYIHDGASAKFSTNSHETDNSVVRKVQNSPRNLLRCVWNKMTAGRTPGYFSMCIFTRYCLANMKDNGGVSRSPSRIPHCLIECGLRILSCLFPRFFPWFVSVLRFHSWIFIWN